MNKAGGISNVGTQKFYNKIVKLPTNFMIHVVHTQKSSVYLYVYIHLTCMTVAPGCEVVTMVSG